VGEWQTLNGGIDDNCIDSSKMQDAKNVQWTLLGPGSRLFVPGQWAHFSIALSSSVVVSTTRTYFPHQQLVALSWHLVHNLPFATWPQLSVEDTANWIGWLCKRATAICKDAESERGYHMPPGGPLLRFVLECWAVLRPWLTSSIELLGDAELLGRRSVVRVTGLPDLLQVQQPDRQRGRFTSTGARAPNSRLSDREVMSAREQVECEMNWKNAQNVLKALSQELDEAARKASGAPTVPVKAASSQRKVLKPSYP
jgi:hypothetical protein